MFKSFFGKVGSTIKSIPHAVTTVAKNTAITVLGIAYFIFRVPIVVIAFYAHYFKSFGDICINHVKGFFGKFKKPVIKVDPIVVKI